MDTSKAKKKTTSKKTTIEPIKVDMKNTEVTSVRVVETKKGDLVFFTLKINGVYINNCKVATGKDGDFIGWPQYQGSNDKWYNVCYVPLSDEDTEIILQAVQDKLDEDED